MKQGIAHTPITTFTVVLVAIGLSSCTAWNPFKKDKPASGDAALGVAAGMSATPGPFSTAPTATPGTPAGAATNPSSPPPPREILTLPARPAPITLPAAPTPPPTPRLKRPAPAPPVITPAPIPEPEPLSPPKLDDDGFLPLSPKLPAEEPLLPPS